MNPPAPPPAHPTPEQLQAFCLGKLTEKDLLAIHAHLERCPGCSQKVAQAREDTFLRNLREGGQPSPPPPPGHGTPALGMPPMMMNTQASTHITGAAGIGETAAWKTPAGAVGASAPPPPAPPGIPSPGAAFAASPVPPPPNIPGLEPAGLLGRGGMGVVYLVKQTGLNRMAALKVLRRGDSAGIQDLSRFKAEAEIIAKLQHDNIVQIYQVGEHGGNPYLLLEYMEGGTLAQKIADAPLAPRQAAAITMTLARAIQFAHEKGVVHRDLKPSNILLNPFGKPKITDFGLAKQIDLQSVTQTQAILGTPSYMAPEQASGRSRESTPLTDVYALGAMLYEMLVGRPPFKGANPLTTLRLVIRAEPISPRRLQPEVPPDLEAVCLKCLEKDPAQRYPSAQALAEDMRRFLGNEAVLARPPNWWGRTVRWVRRRPALTSLIGLSLVTLVILVFLLSSWVYSSRLEGALAETERQKKLVENEQRQTKEQLAETERQKKLVEAEQARTREQKARATYLAGLYAAQESLELGTASAVADFLARTLPEKGEKDFRGFEWFHLFHECNREAATLRHPVPIHAIALSPNDTWLASADRNHHIKIWDFMGRKEHHSFEGHTKTIVSLAFSPDNKTLASASQDETVRLWNAETKTPGLQLPGHEDGASACVFDPKGRFLVTGSKRGVIRLWAFSDPVVKPRILAKLPMPVTALAIAPGGKFLASNGSRENHILLWDLDTEKSEGAIPGHRNVLSSLTFSPKGDLLASASDDGEIIIWDPVNGAQVKSLILHRGPVPSLAFRPTDNTLFSASFDHSVRRWNDDKLRGWGLFGVGLGHTGKVTGVAVTSDGKYAVSSGYDKVIRIWDINLLQDPLRARVHEGEATAMAFTQDGSLFSLGVADKMAYKRSLGADALTDLRFDFKILAHPTCLAQRGESDILILGGNRTPEGPGELYQIRFPGPRTWLPDLIGVCKGGIQVLAVSKDGRFAATSGSDRKIVLWDISLKLELGALEGHTDQIHALAFSPDGKTLASGGSGDQVFLWDVEKKKVKMRLKDFAGQVACLAFAQDAKFLMLGGENKTSHQCPLQVWDLENNRSYNLLKGHTGTVNALAISPDGKQLATASHDQTVKLWDWASGEERATYKEHIAPLKSIIFSPDGRTLISGDEDGTLVVRRGATDEEVRARVK